mgnify:CR=1 FL=1
MGGPQQLQRPFIAQDAEFLARHDALPLERIIGVTHPGNRASQHVLTKIGMADEGWGRYYDRRLRLFAILGSEL